MYIMQFLTTFNTEKRGKLKKMKYIARTMRTISFFEI